MAHGGQSVVVLAGCSRTIDLLKGVVLEKTYEDLSEHTFLQGDVALLRWDVALAVKINCFYHRADDENGEKKKQTDIQDVAWISSEMEARELSISDSVAAMFKTGHYTLLLVRLELSQEQVDRLVAVGAKKLLRSWEEDSEEQKEYFEFFAPAGTCPLTGTLRDDEDA